MAVKDVTALVDSVVKFMERLNINSTERFLGLPGKPGDSSAITSQTHYVYMCNTRVPVSNTSVGFVRVGECDHKTLYPLNTPDMDFCLRITFYDFNGCLI